MTLIMQRSKKFIQHLVLDEIAGIITIENSTTLKKLLENNPAMNVLREELYRELSTPQAATALKRMKENLTIEELWEQIKKNEKRKAFRGSA
jgi:transmembrane sensor